VGRYRELIICIQQKRESLGGRRTSKKKMVSCRERPDQGGGIDQDPGRSKCVTAGEGRTELGGGGALSSKNEMGSLNVLKKRAEPTVGSGMVEAGKKSTNHIVGLWH